MKIGPRYKIARRLGAAIYDKTQTAKFATRQAKKSQSGKGKGKSFAKSEFGIQMLEKQKARFTYGMNERQFAKYVKNSLAQKKTKPEEILFEMLESRLDNVVYRLGLANSRAFGRQLVSHGHITVNSKKVTIPSYNVSPQDKVAIRGGSLNRKPFENIGEKIKNANIPTWLSFNVEKKEAEIHSLPKYAPGQTIFDISAILEFYKR
jgi:small subunit ribosomal protein S4